MFFSCSLLTIIIKNVILTLEKNKGELKMKSVKTFKYDKFIEVIIQKYGFASYQTLMFIRLVESTNDSKKVMMMYNKLIQTK